MAVDEVERNRSICRFVLIGEHDGVEALEYGV